MSVCACLSMEEGGREDHVTAYKAVQVPKDYRRMSGKVTHVEAYRSLALV